MKLSTLALGLAGLAVSSQAATTDTLIFQGFGASPNQAKANTLAAAKSLADSGVTWKGGGWWYTYMDTTGAKLTDGLDQKLDSMDQIWSDSLMHVKFVGDNDHGQYPFLGIGTGLVGDGTTSYDLTGMTTVIFKARGDGSIRFKFETTDQTDYGSYGYVLDLTADWQTYVVPVTDIGGDGALASKDLSDALTGVKKVAFQSSSATTTDLYLKEIAFVGLKLSDVVPTGTRTGIRTRMGRSVSDFHAAIHGQNLEVTLAGALLGSRIEMVRQDGSKVASWTVSGVSASLALPAGLEKGNYFVFAKTATGIKAGSVTVVR